MMSRTMINPPRKKQKCLEIFIEKNSPFYLGNWNPTLILPSRFSLELDDKLTGVL